MKRIKRLFDQIEAMKGDEVLLEFWKLIIITYPEFKKKRVAGAKVDFLKEVFPFRQKLERSGFSWKRGKESYYMGVLTDFAFHLMKQTYSLEIASQKSLAEK